MKLRKNKLVDHETTMCFKNAAERWESSTTELSTMSTQSIPKYSHPTIWWKTRAIVIIRSRMQNETSPVSKQAGNPAKIAGSPGRILSLVDPAWQRDSLVNQTVSKIVSLRMSLQKMELLFLTKNIQHWNVLFEWRVCYLKFYLNNINL